jgi:hypothetical protein
MSLCDVIWPCLALLMIIGIVIVIGIMFRSIMYVNHQSNFSEKQVVKGAKQAANIIGSTFGRGSGYGWKFGDKMNDSGMIKRCEKDHGSGNCEKWGAVMYPKCAKLAGDKQIENPNNYAASGCCTCMRKS